MKITLGSKKVVEIVDEYGFEQELRAAELAEAPAEMTRAESMLLAVATVLVAVKSVDGKSIEEVTGGALEAKAMLVAFRKSFTDGEWAQLLAQTNKVYETGEGKLPEATIQPS
jgi:hypothetical protein